MKIELSLSFKRNSLNSKTYIDLFDKFIKFEPYSFTKKYTTKEWNEKKHKKIIAEANGTETLIVSNRKGDIFIVGDTGSKTPHLSIEIIQDKEVFFPSNEEIETIITAREFVAAYLNDEEYVYVQSTPYESNFKGRNLDLSSIINTPYKISEHGDREYDTSYNPGRKDLIGYTWIMAAWKMWFGEPFFELVPKERILSFPDAIEIKELPYGQVYVQLFEKIEESASKENMDKQRKWREWLNFDELIKKYP